MPHPVLARKWRPHNFEQMIGQEAILQMLTHALTDGRIHHAYLFTGTRGVGKTTVARIFAKCLNCETGITATPCNQCTACQSIDAGRFVDLLEIDAASRTKVEDTRELLDNVQYSPTQGRFKIYLIDEVHMLSGHSFNALLKTLEEPPEHVKFLLATTDPKRLPITILSRCLQFNLRHVSEEQIASHLAAICTEEKINFELDALHLIANAADGSVRDALSLLDQAITFCREKITIEKIRTLLGYVEQTSVIELLKALAKQDGRALYETLQLLLKQAPDFQHVLAEVISLLHQMTLAHCVPDLSLPTAIQQLAKQFSPEEIQLYYQIALMGKRDLPYVPNPAQGFEMIMLRMLAFKPGTAQETVAPVKKTIAPTPTPNVSVNVTPPPTPAANLNWSELLPKLQLKGVAQALASNCSLKNFHNNKLELALSAEHQALLTDKLTDRIQETLTQYFQQPIKVDIQITENLITTPAKEKQEKRTQQQNQATSVIHEDEQVKSILDTFNATIDPKSIKAIE